jgi:hypothetical protein
VDSDGDLIHYRRNGSTKAKLDITGNNLRFDVGGGIKSVLTTDGKLLLGSTAAYSSGNCKLEVGNNASGQIQVGRPSNHWASGVTFLNVANYGQLDTHGAYEVTLTAGGYRKYVNGVSTWEDYTVNGQAGYGAQIALNPTNGKIFFRTESGMSSGDASNITHRMMIDADGRVGINTTTPGNTNGNVKLQVEGVTQISSTLNVFSEINLNGTPQDKYFDASITDGTTDYWMSFRAVRGNDASEHTTQMRYQNDGACELCYDGALKLDTQDHGVRLRGGGEHVSNGHFRPWTDDTWNLGTSSFRWDNVYAANGTIQTSDRNEKNTIVQSDLGLSFIDQLKPVSYKFNGKDKTHYGLIAQDLEEVLEKEGKSLDEFAGIVKDKKYGLNYSELISPLIKAVQELSAKVAALEAR